MKYHPMLSRPAQTIALHALFVGILSAAMISPGLHNTALSSAPAGGSASVQTQTIQKVFSPSVAALAFIPGAIIGGLIGYFWTRTGFARIIASTLIILLAGIAGAACAAHFGDRITITVSSNSTEIVEGASTTVIATGAIIGMMIAAAGIWRFSRRPGTSNRSEPFPI